ESELFTHGNARAQGRETPHRGLHISDSATSRKKWQVGEAQVFCRGLAAEMSSMRFSSHSCSRAVRGADADASRPRAAHRAVDARRDRHEVCEPAHVLQMR